MHAAAAAAALGVLNAADPAETGQLYNHTSARRFTANERNLLHLLSRREWKK